MGRLALVARDLVEYFAAEFANPPPACLDDIKQRLSRKALFGKRRLRAESRRGSPLKPRFPGAIGKLGAGRNEFPFRRLELHLHTAELAPDSIYWQRGGGTWRYRFESETASGGSTSTGTDSEGSGEMIVAPFHPRSWSARRGPSSAHPGPRCPISPTSYERG